MMIPGKTGLRIKKLATLFPAKGCLSIPAAAAGSDGPLPSMRLKWLRKGVEDYEYVAMLKQAGRGEWALNAIRGVAADWDSWTRSTQDLEAVRRKLGAELDRLEAGKSARPVSQPHSPNRSQTIH